MFQPVPLLRRAAPSALCLCLAVACCPPLRVSYATPEETLATWQAQLCRDHPEGEYRCLSRSLQQMMGGFETYFAARQRLLDDDPVVGFLVQRVDLPGRAVESTGSPDGLRHVMVFDESATALQEIDFFPWEGIAVDDVPDSPKEAAR